MNRICRNCESWDSEHPRVKLCPDLEWMPNPGICRRNKPGAQQLTQAVYIGVQPYMDADDSCGAFKRRQELR